MAPTYDPNITIEDRLRRAKADIDCLVAELKAVEQARRAHVDGWLYQSGKDVHARVADARVFAMLLLDGLTYMELATRPPAKEIA